MGSAGLGGGVSGTGAGVGCSGGGGSTVHIHPQAAPVVCRHVLDTLIQLAKVSLFQTLVWISGLNLVSIGFSLEIFVLYFFILVSVLYNF